MAINKKYKADNPEKNREIKRREYINNSERYRDYNLRRYYGITLEEYEEKLKQQNYCCKICQNKTTTRKNNRFDVDHCHKTGKIRGLLCSHCNIILSRCNDNEEILIKAIAYLREYHADFS